VLPLLEKRVPSLTAKEPEWNRRAKAVADKIRDFSQLVLELTPSAREKAVAEQGKLPIMIPVT